MDLSKILSIAGKNGLFKVITQGKNAVIVESLIDGKRFPAFGNEKISSLEEISVFTTGDDIPLKDVFKALYEKLEAQPTPHAKSDNATLKKFFLTMVPEYDQERVYVSDMKKMLAWYNLLLENQLLAFTEEPEAKDEDAPVESTDIVEDETATPEKA